MKSERNERLSPDEFRKMKYGVDGTKIFICQVTPGIFTVKALGRQFGATTKEQMIDIISEALSTRFNLK